MICPKAEKCPLSCQSKHKEPHELKESCKWEGFNCPACIPVPSTPASEGMLLTDEEIKRAWWDCYGEELPATHGLVFGRAVRSRKETYSAWSFVDGKLDVISVHHQPSFVIFEHGSQQAVYCTFPDSWMSTVKDYLGLRVITEGYVHYNEKGLPISLSEPTSLEKVPDPKQQDILAYRGSMPGISGGLSSYEYVRQLRESNA